MPELYPFKILNSYGQGDAARFFGRDEEIAQLYEMVFQSNILTVYGASGTGKTSLIQCGLAGKFKPHDWYAIYVRRGADINESLNAAMIAAGATTGITDVTTSLNEIYLDKFRPVYFIFDQFEELFILGKKEKSEQEKFIGVVKEILSIDQPVKLIFSIREEYIGRLYDFEKQVPQLMRKKLRVEPMDQSKVTQVIINSVKDSSITLRAGKEEAIAEAIFTKVKGDDNARTVQLPYLQVYLYKLYLATRADKDKDSPAVFSLEAIAKMGNIGDILREFLDEQVKTVKDELNKGAYTVSEDTIWDTLSPLATLEGTKSPKTIQELVGDLVDIDERSAERVLNAFVSKFILRCSDCVYELAHDTLAGKIAARRSAAQVERLEVQQMVVNQVKQQRSGGDLFTEKQLLRVDTCKGLKLNEDATRLVKDSRREIGRRKRVRNVWIAVAISCLAATVVILSFAYKYAVDKRELAIIAEGNAKEAIKTADSLKNLAEISTLESKKKEAEVEQLYGDILREKALYQAREDESFGDSYKDNDNLPYAMDSYEEAIDTIYSYKRKDSLRNPVAYNSMKTHPIDPYFDSLKAKYYFVKARFRR